MYTNIKIYISDRQKNKIKQAFNKQQEVTLQFSCDDLKGEGNYIISVTKRQLNKINKAYENGKGTRITMSTKQVIYNKKIEGGFIGSLLAGIASAIVPPLINKVVESFSHPKEEIRGKGLYLKQGNGMVKPSKLGDGLYLRP